MKAARSPNPKTPTEGIQQQSTLRPSGRSVRACHCGRHKGVTAGSPAGARAAISVQCFKPVFDNTRDAIQAHLTIVFTALALSREAQNRTGLAIRNLIRQLRPLRSATIAINGTEQTFPWLLHELFWRTKNCSKTPGCILTR